MWSSWKGAAKARLAVAGLAVSLIFVAGAAAPATAQERLEQDFGLIKACAGDVWRLCSDVLPDVGKMKSCMQNKMGELPKACLDKLLDTMAGSYVQGLQGPDLCALRRGALQCVRRRRVLPVRAEARRQHQLAVSDGQGGGRLLGQRRGRQ